MKLHNTLTRKVEPFKPFKEGHATIYSCGPTVYDHIHIGNLRSFVNADTLNRVLQANGLKTKQVMNFTDIDDKIIQRSHDTYPDDSPEQALKHLTEKYEEIFLTDMAAIGNAVDDITFVKATDSIAQMQALITQLYEAKVAYIADGSVYFSIKAYKETGKKYGQLLELTTANTSEARIDNDEYDKESVHDFALWKAHLPDEPAWDFELDGHNLPGRPGWHIECSAMSSANLGQPFDIHTGGIDLIFPHHENEIAQSTAVGDDQYARFFVHNEYLLVDGRKMAKSAQNFFTLQDVRERGFDPLAFRLLVLQAHYRSPLNFSWDNLQAAQNRLNQLRAWADLRHQPTAGVDEMPKELDDLWGETLDAIKDDLANDLDTPSALAHLARLVNYMEQHPIPKQNGKNTGHALEFLDSVFGLQLNNNPDITDEQKQLLKDRQAARDSKDWAKTDALRDQLKEQGILVRDTDRGQIWSRQYS